MVSEMYVGEIVMHVLVYLVQQHLHFRGQIRDKLLLNDAVLTKYLIGTEWNPPHMYYSTNYMLLEDLLVPIVEPIDSKIVHCLRNRFQTRRISSWCRHCLFIASNWEVRSPLASIGRCTNPTSIARNLLWFPLTGRIAYQNLLCSLQPVQPATK
ncbi:unnamed protein product [Dicrocoelium dendriticum]|nr:unnamed protein product [Dicrocoelium dendriticum]